MAPVYSSLLCQTFKVWRLDKRMTFQSADPGVVFVGSQYHEIGVHRSTCWRHWTSGVDVRYCPLTKICR